MGSTSSVFMGFVGRGVLWSSAWEDLCLCIMTSCRLGMIVARIFNTRPTLLDCSKLVIAPRARHLFQSFVLEDYMFRCATCSTLAFFLGFLSLRGLAASLDGLSWSELG